MARFALYKWAKKKKEKSEGQRWLDEFRAKEKKKEHKKKEKKRKKENEKKAKKAKKKWYQKQCQNQ
jgi:hypothetical protein